MNAQTENETMRDRINRAIAEQGLSMRELGRRAGIAGTTIARVLESDQDPKFETIQKIAEGLGMTAGELLGTANGGVTLQSDGVTLVAVADLEVSALNPRKRFNDEDLAELASSIAKQGVLQNLTVRHLRARQPSDASAIGDIYEVIIGGRRLRAAQLNIRDGVWPGDAVVPCRIVEVDDLQALTMATAENIARETMHPIEEAEAFVEIESRGVKPAAIAEAIGKSPRFVQERIRIGRHLDDKAKDAFRENRMTFDQARELARAPAEAQRAVIAKAKSRMGQGAKKTAGVSFVNVPMRDLRHELRDPYPVASVAIFDRADYAGEMMAAEELDTEGDFSGWYNSPYGVQSDEERFVDVEQFQALQRAAVEERKAVLLGERGVKWVDIVDHDHYLRVPSHEVYSATSRESDGSGRGVVIGICPKTLAVQEFPKMFRRGSGKKAEKGANGKADKPAGPTDPIDGIRTGRIEYAKRAKTLALRDKVAKDPKIAVCLAVISLLSRYGNLCLISRDNIPAGNEIRLPDPARGALEAYIERLSPELQLYEDDQRHCGFLENIYGDERGTSQANVFRSLMEWSSEDLSGFFAVLIARSVVVSTVGPLGDDPLEIEVAEASNLDMVDYWRMDEAYLKTLAGDDLKRFAKRVHLGGGKPDPIRKAKLATLRGDVLKHLDAEQLNMVPPEMEFGTTEQIQQRIREQADKVDGELFPQT